MTLLINKPKVAKLLFIKGVFKKDCVSDDIFEKKILERIDSGDQSSPLNGECSGIYTNNFISYEKLPSIFEDINTWQKQTNLLCWNCSLSFTSIPVFIPQAIEPCSHQQMDRKYSIGVHGVFCSFICAKHYVKTRYHTLVDRTETLNKLDLLYKLFYNSKMNDVTDYPLPFQMKQYGGDLSVEEFMVLMEESKKEEASI
jgi:hypothetical protein